MKKLFLFLIICASLVASCKSPKAQEGSETVVSETPRIHPLSDGNIVYVELDSLTANYQMTKDLGAELQEKMSKLETDLTNRQRRFQNNVNDFQNKANKQLETRARLAEIHEQLGQEEQQLMQLAERYRMEMAEEEMVMQRKILQAIMDYLKEYNMEKGYKYILGNAFDAKILYADPSLDITSDVLQGINAKYNSAGKK